MGMTNNERAFEDMTGMSEGTMNSPATKCAGYDVIVTGIDGKPEIFTDFSKHPFANRAPKVINSHGLTSTASGKVQILLHWWNIYAVLLKLPDFSPESQELYFMQQLREHKALQKLAVNDFLGALQAVSGLWASLPGKAYVGQTQHTIERVQKFYTDAGGTIATPATSSTVLPGAQPQFPSDQFPPVASGFIPLVNQGV